MSIQQQLVENIALLQEIHSITHLIDNLEYSCVPTQRKRWTKSEDELLSQAVMVFGPRHLDKLTRVVMSKSREQVYFRVRYLGQHPDVYSARKITQFK